MKRHLRLLTDPNIPRSLLCSDVCVSLYIVTLSHLSTFRCLFVCLYCISFLTSYHMHFWSHLCLFSILLLSILDLHLRVLFWTLIVAVWLLRLLFSTNFPCLLFPPLRNAHVGSCFMHKCVISTDVIIHQNVCRKVYDWFKTEFILFAIT